ncbi:MAG: hypothetical protein ABJE95_26395 [Byssovorax sp.]
MRLCAALAPAALFALFLTPACAGAQKATDPNWSDEKPEQSRPLRETEDMTGSRAGASFASQPGVLGVRHDLMLSEGAHPARCNCLAVEVGPAADPRFFWTAGAPSIGDTAVAVALGARGVTCSGGDADDKRRPSISAVDLIGDDVIVEVEDLPDSRPLASGAVIPKPGPRGNVYVRPRNPKVIYAKGAPGGRCKVL